MTKSPKVRWWVSFLTVAAVAVTQSTFLAAGAAPRDVPGSPTPVDIFGDSTGLVFAYSGVDHATELNVQVNGDTPLGCGLVPYNHVSEGKVVVRPADCAGWQTRWKTKLQDQPDAVVGLMTGAWDVLDYHTSAGTIRFGTRAWANLLRASLHAALKLLTADGRTVQLFEVPCYGKDSGDPPLPERGDPKRIAAVNVMFNLAAKTMPHVVMVHWRTLVCPNGHRRTTLDGVPLWLDGADVHLSDAGGLAVWKWWLPQIRTSG